MGSAGECHNECDSKIEMKIKAHQVGCECEHGTQGEFGTCAFCDRDEAQEALREIARLCGNGDISDGEGTSCAEVVSMVRELVHNGKHCVRCKHVATVLNTGDICNDCWLETDY